MKLLQTYLQEGALPIEIRERVEIHNDWYCPHCGNKIQEKSTYYKDGKHYHRGCNGEIKLPPPSPEQQEFLDMIQKKI
jgi:hypothetical protein